MLRHPAVLVVRRGRSVEVRPGQVGRFGAPAGPHADNERGPFVANACLRGGATMPSVLIAEDDNDLCGAMEMIFGRAGYRVLTAGTG